MYPFDKYKKYLLNRNSVTPDISETIEMCLSTDEENAKYHFHKVMIHKWTEDEAQLFDMISDYFAVKFVPVNYQSQNVVTTFYTSSLSLIMKIIKLDFMFPYARNMFNIDLLFNDKTAVALFKSKTSIENIVTEVVSKRFNEHCELNLSDISHDPEFIEKNIQFYKLGLLANFKILMLRMGRDTKFLNLSNNNLSQVPSEILNFFIKGNLIGVNLSNNNIPSISELVKMSSKIEKLWLEGNPLCENVDPSSYIKQMVQKFPRLTELDGVKLNNNGIMLTFYRNYLEQPDKKTKMIVEKFVSLYFAYYDSMRRKVNEFYDDKAQLSISTNLNEIEESVMKRLSMHNRNLLKPNKHPTRLYKTKQLIVSVLTMLPLTLHDPTTFTVDVLRHDNKALILVIDGTYKEIPEDGKIERYFRFRRTFIFSVYTINNKTVYLITNDMFSTHLATPDQIRNSFQHPIRHLNQLTLIDPTSEDKIVVIKAFMHYTSLKRSFAEARLEKVNWDIRQALKEFCSDLKKEKICDDNFAYTEELSDTSSVCDEIDY